jgi:hypothetical protein
LPKTGSLLIAVRQKRRRTILRGLLLFAAVAEALLIYLGRSHGSTARERARSLPGDRIVAEPDVVTNHAISIGVPPESVWPWLTQMGWHRAGWYTARWVDQLLFPANWPSADRLIPELPDIKIGSFVPDGPPETECGFIVEELNPGRALVLHSTTHVPELADQVCRFPGLVVDLQPHSVDNGSRTRFHFRSRWIQSHGGSPFSDGSSSCQPTSSCREICCTVSRSGPSAQSRCGRGERR